jgi:hypothetical protein
MPEEKKKALATAAKKVKVTDAAMFKPMTKKGLTPMKDTKKPSDGGTKKPAKKPTMIKDDWMALDTENRKRGTNITTREQVREYRTTRVPKEEWDKMSKDSKKRGTNLISNQQIRENRASRAIDKSNSRKLSTPKGKNFLAGRGSK